MRRKRAVIATAGLLLVCTFLGAFAPKASASAFEGGTGISGDPYLIATPQQLDAVRDDLTAHYKLVDDIDLSTYVASGGEGYNDGKGWEPIGTMDDGTMPATFEFFEGVFDGDGHVISGLAINRPQETNVALFRGLKAGATVKNVGVEGVSVLGQQQTAGLAGKLEGAISGSYATGTVSGMSFVGGLVGIALGGDITNSYALASVSSTSVGGIYWGGLVGSLTVGSSVESSFAAGVVSEGGSGLLGATYQAQVLSSYYDKDASGRTDTSRGEGKTTAQMRLQATYAGWDFENVWKIEEGNSYPQLKVFTVLPAPTLEAAEAGNAVVDLAWMPVELAEGYKVYQRAEGDSYGSELATVGASVYSYPATGLTNGTKYYFVVKAVRAERDSPASNELEAVPQLPASAAVPFANPAGGAVVPGTSVALGSATSGATIYYTTDGTTPTTLSTLYSGPITVTQAMTIKAIATKAEMLDSDVMSESYTVVHILKGDVNGDGYVTPADALYITKYMQGKLTLTNVQLQMLDMNNDSAVDNQDATIILQIYLAGGQPG